ncbi:MAG TPA: iron uptake transporter deferrochelatase/peroxidase subunit [Jatrophihabitans sp.]|jgi:deferrochelatase/peroxidase EfeB|uniref:iron uptake transporter deferrochelatase/peroxidase subunit n=1 Tax=Jatrophihabitans sp. TaxID=1932789 RepID=UPI002E0CC770|nr:iron uptake transporter deferrochelatase/peroxidase subunit [Jatrophihabitans sp.]
MPSGSSRRTFLTAALGTAGAVATGGAGFGVARATEPGPAPAGAVVGFYGAHQAGIATSAQEHLAFAAFDVTTGSADELARLLGTWAAAAAQLTKGRPVGAVETAPDAPPIDTGEVEGLGAAQLTITVGFGPTLFDDRFGLASRRPAALAEIPALPGDTLDPARSGGDLCVQACADDPQVAFHTMRNFARLARGTAVLRWSQLGFGRTASTSTAQDTPRNLMGFKDGTNNIKAEEPHDLARHVWVGDETDQAWLRGGSYLVARRIRMLIESWDTAALAEQERVLGRAKGTGAPLGERREFDPLDLTATKAGMPLIDRTAHIRLAAPATNAGRKLLRRGYSYTDGIDASTGLLDAGLFFLAYQNDPVSQFVAIQRRLARHDALNEYIRHTGSALFAVPPGLSGPGDWWGRDLFG